MATDDIILTALSRDVYNLTATTLHKYFTITTTNADMINFLNYRIIQSSHGLIINQTDNIYENVLNDYFPDLKKSTPKKSLST